MPCDSLSNELPVAPQLDCLGFHLEVSCSGTSVVVQWLDSTFQCRGAGSVPDGGAKMPHVRVQACVLSGFSHVQLFVTLRASACQAPLSVGLSRQECWHGSPCPPPGGLSGPVIKPGSLTSPTLAGGFFATGTAWEAQDPTFLMAKKSEQQKQYCNKFDKEFLRIVHIKKKKKSPKAATELQTSYPLKMQISEGKVSSE